MLTDDLLELQRIDTTVDQLSYRRAHLPERAESDAAEASLTEVDRRLAALEARDGELERAIAALEEEGARIGTQRARLESQLRTVSAVRQADALTHELEALAARRDGLDDEELAHLEEQSEVTGERETLGVSRPTLAAAAESAGAALGAAEGLVDAELADLAAARAALVEGVDAALLERYTRMRARFGGVAVARLDGARCTGCHLDLSTAELAEVRETPPGEFADCPQCGRLLVP